jgi:hypothetical protein
MSVAVVVTVTLMVAVPRVTMLFVACVPAVFVMPNVSVVFLVSMVSAVAVMLVAG